MLERAYGYLDGQLATPPPTNEGWWPSYTAWQAFAVKVLVEGGKNADSHITRLYGYRERMPVFAVSYLYDALVAKGEGSGDRAADLRRRIGNAILPEAAAAHVEELNDPYLMWYWNSNVRSTAPMASTNCWHSEVSFSAICIVWPSLMQQCTGSSRFSPVRRAQALRLLM